MVAVKEETGCSSLEWLLDYEVRASGRYRRFISLALVSIGLSAIQFRKALGDAIRGSDEIVELDDQITIAILMSETDGLGAMRAIERLQTRCSKDVSLRWAVASYPHDGSTAQELLATAHRRYEEAAA